MTLFEILESGLIKDHDTIEINLDLKVSGIEVRTGKWYEDKILANLNRKVMYIEFDPRDRYWIIDIEKDREPEE